MRDKTPEGATALPASSAYRRLVEPYKEFRRFSRRSELMWRYTCNLKNVVSHRFSGPPCSAAAARVVKDLNRNGVALTSVSELLDSQTAYRDLVSAVDQLEIDKRSVVEEARGRSTVQRMKQFNLELLDAYQPERGGVYERFASQAAVKSVADGYYGMTTKLRACNVWHTLVAQEPARQSQLWHRDPEDRYILKMFVLLSDVDDKAGPFMYAAGTHMKGNRNRPFVDRHGLQDVEMEPIVPADQWVKATGPRGTIVFADTRGYHKGGLVQERERLLFVSMFLSY